MGFWPEIFHLVDILVQFWLYQTALTAHLEKASLMVSVEEADHDVLQFIWVADATREVPNLKVYRFVKLVSSFLKPVFAQHQHKIPLGEVPGGK